MTEQGSLSAGYLAPTDKAVVGFARDRRRVAGVMRDRLGLSAAVYRQRLLALADRVEAADDTPGLVARLRARRGRGVTLPDGPAAGRPEAHRPRRRRQTSPRGAAPPSRG